MSDETPWGRFPDHGQHPDFAKAYRRLQPERRSEVDQVIAHAAQQMHELLEHRMLLPLTWPGVSPAAARSIDMAERTCMAMGVFRLAIAGRLGTGRTDLSDGLDRAADNVDKRAIQFALHALSDKYPKLREVNAGDNSAYHMLLNHTVRHYSKDAFELAHEQSQLSEKLDLTLETGLNAGVLLSIVVSQDQIRRDVRKQTAVSISELPVELAVALWLVAIKGLGRLFGEDDKTMAYAD